VVLAPQTIPELEGAPSADRTALPAAARAPEPAAAAARAADRRSRDLANARSPSMTIHGRALSSERVPLANFGLRCFVVAIGRDASGMERGRTMSQPSSTTTDDRGAFDAKIDLWNGLEQARSELFVLTQDPHSDAMWRGRMEIEVRPEGSFDAGDVVLGPAPQVLGGIVVNEQGAPVPTILVDVVDREASRGDLDESFLGLRPVSTGKDGRFVIASWTRSQDLSIRIDHRDYRPVRLDHLRPPQLDLRVVLVDSGAASIRFSLLFDEECGAALRGRAVRTDAVPGANPPYRSNAGTVPGEQVIRPVLPGEYRLEIFDISTGIVVGQIDGLKVPEHRVCEDARLRPIDLRGRLGCTKAYLIDVQGHPLADREVTIRGPAGEGRLLTDKNGCISIASPPGSPEVSVVEGDGSVTPIVDGAQIIRRVPRKY
jgi:hypothetical protein